MAELDATTIQGYLTTIDTQIAALTTSLGAGGLGSAAAVDYKIGNIEIKASQRMESLIKAREMYQALLNKLPSDNIDNTTYDIGRDGKDDSDIVGDI